MKLTRWLGFCAMAGGAGAVISESILGREGFATLTKADSDLRIIGGAVILVGVLAMIIGDLENEKFPTSKGPPS